MSRFFAYAHRVHARHNRAGLFLSLVVTAFILALAAGAHAQFGAPPAGTRVLDPSVLRPPAGARVALVEFADMECPDCARANTGESAPPPDPCSRQLHRNRCWPVRP